MGKGKRRRQRLGASARVAARRFFARAKEVLTTEPGQSEVDAAELAEARERARGAGELKGGVVKIAQLEGYFHGPGAALDDDARTELSWLWDSLPPMSADAARQVVREDLGRDPEELFASWEAEPFASASIGQVHGAVGHDGTEYAVKVQYPEAAAALRDDLESTRLTRQLAGAEAGQTLDDDGVEALRRAVLRELDYEAEADAQLRFREAYLDDAEVVIPEVTQGLSSKRVLTMERIGGRRLADVGADDDAALRSAVARVLFRVAWGAPLTRSLLNADPNPGNYLHVPGAETRVAFLDYGCTTTLDQATVQNERRLWRAFLRSDPFDAAEQFRMSLQDQGMVRDPSTIFGNLYREWEKLLFAPFAASEGFAWSRRYAFDLTETTSRLVRGGGLCLPAPVVLLWRQRLGVAAVLGNLDPRVDFRSLLREMVREQ